ncbi:MAG TPA: sulfite oxidase-like oxidoreductase [Pyrinomonadaceae bacterium]|jgi:DMSO/TMAO reductase YedYZ molybdopterin-dependent catalytic subunit
MSFFKNPLFDPFYQKAEPRRAEAVENSDPEIIISPDTRREKRLPPGQSRTKKFPVLDAHGTPDIDLENWTFTVEGAIEKPLSLTLDELKALPPVKVYADFHCVTRWSRLDNVWTGVAARHLAKIAGLKETAKFVVATAFDEDGYGKNWTTNFPIEYFLNEDSLVAYEHDGRPVTPEHGGPVRLIIPQLYAWKSAKWLKGLRFTTEDEAGFWERGGYHMRGVPWNGSDGERYRW